MGCCQAGAVGYLVADGVECRFQRRQQGKHIAVAGGVAHQADAPGPAAELAQPAADFDVVAAGIGMAVAVGVSVTVGCGVGVVVAVSMSSGVVGIAGLMLGTPIESVLLLQADKATTAIKDVSPLRARSSSQVGGTLPVPWHFWILACLPITIGLQLSISMKYTSKSGYV